MFILLKLEPGSKRFASLGESAAACCREAMIAGLSRGIEPLVKRLRDALDIEIPPANGGRVVDLAIEFDVMRNGRVDVHLFAYPAATQRPEPLFCLTQAKHASGSGRSVLCIPIKEETFGLTPDPKTLFEHCRYRADVFAQRCIDGGLPAELQRGFAEISWAFRRLSQATPPIIRTEEAGSPWVTTHMQGDDPVNDENEPTIILADEDLEGPDIPLPDVLHE